MSSKKQQYVFEGMIIHRNPETGEIKVLSEPKLYIAETRQQATVDVLRKVKVSDDIPSTEVEVHVRPFGGNANDL